MPPARLDVNAVAAVRERLRRGLLPTIMRGRWEHGGGLSIDASVRIEAADRA